MVKANGSALSAGNLAGTSSFVTSMPAVKTSYTLWTSNAMFPTLAQLGAAVTVISVTSASSDALPSALYGAGAVLLDGTTQFPGQTLIAGRYAAVPGGVVTPGALTARPRGGAAEPH